MLTRIDELLRRDHSYLSDTDACYFFGEYTPRAGFSISATNDLILNLKKDPSRRDKPEWRWKERAISKAAEQIRESVDVRWLRTVTFVPIPPSRHRSDPSYDDRLVQVLNAIDPSAGLDIRDLLVQSESSVASHASELRPTPYSIAQKYSIDESIANPTPKLICVFDDVLTTGAHFKAAQYRLAQRYPGVASVGLFLARRVLPVEPAGD